MNGFKRTSKGTKSGPQQEETEQSGGLGGSGGNFGSGGSGVFKCDLSGLDSRLKDFAEFIVDYVANKAISEGLITAGV